MQKLHFGGKYEYRSVNDHLYHHGRTGRARGVVVAGRRVYRLCEIREQDDKSERGCADVGFAGRDGTDPRRYRHALDGADMAFEASGKLRILFDDHKAAQTDLCVKKMIAQRSV